MFRPDGPALREHPHLLDDEDVAAPHRGHRSASLGTRSGADRSRTVRYKTFLPRKSSPTRGRFPPQGLSKVRAATEGGPYQT
jgi:hypothetical protein